MAQQSYRANLSAKSWPLVSKFFGRSVIVGAASHDQNFSRQLYSPEDPDKDIGIPQVYYLHNVMPTAQGFQSIGYVPTVAAVPNVQAQFSVIFTLHYREGSAYFTSTPDGRNYICQFGASPTWVEINQIPGIAGRTITTADINGISYVFFAGLGCYKYSPISNMLDPVTLTGLNPANILGIFSSNGYLLAYSVDAVFWSSTASPTDFVPSLITGAGSQSIQMAKGPLTFCISASTGFTVYTAKNAVVALYTGNARYPFTFREIAFAGGITSLSVVAKDVSDTAHYAYTTIGLQQVSGHTSVIIHPEVTDFLSGKFFEDFDETTNTFIEQQVPLLKKAVNVISNRYLVLSYGVDELTHALVFDLTMKRWGKLKFTHVECVEFYLDASEITEIAKQSIGFLKSDGSIHVVNFEYDDTDTLALHSGVMVLGKYQYVRGRKIVIEEVTFENVLDPTRFTLQDMVSFEGKKIDKISNGYLKYVDGEAVTYNFHDVGMNHSLLLKGNFYGVSLQMDFSVHGAM